MRNTEPTIIAVKPTYIQPIVERIIEKPVIVKVPVPVEMVREKEPEPPKTKVEVPPTPIPEVPKKADQEVPLKPETEEKTSKEEEKSSTPNAEVERKTEEKTSAKGKKRLKRYDGAGRRNTDEEIDEILDAWILYQVLPQDVSDRQRRDYKRHPRLELRRLYLEQAGFIKKGKSGKSAARKNTGRSNVLDLTERKAQRQADAN